MLIDIRTVYERHYAQTYKTGCPVRITATHMPSLHHTFFRIKKVKVEPVLNGGFQPKLVLRGTKLRRLVTVRIEDIEV